MGEARRRAFETEKIQQVMVNANDLPTITCACGKFIFEHVSMFKAVPAIYSNTGKPTLFQIKCLKCLECGMVHPLDKILESINNPQETKPTIEVVSS